MAEPFRILAQFNSDPLGITTDPIGHLWGSVPAKHKWNSESRAYCVPNEVICAELGRFIGLLIPPYAVTFPEGVDAKFWYSELRFSFGSRENRPVLGERVVQELRVVAAGILVFDVFVLNSDRPAAIVMNCWITSHPMNILGIGAMQSAGFLIAFSIAFVPNARTTA